MLTFLFWNLNKRPLMNQLVNLASAHDVDLFILTECAIPDGVLLAQLNEGKRLKYHLPYSLCEKVKILGRFSRRFLTPLSETSRLTIRRLRLPGREEILLAGVHFASKLYWTDNSQTVESVELSKLIRDAEVRAGHSRTVLVGDFNMNPFESGIVSAAGLNAVMTRRIALGSDRTVQGRSYPFFYNPMWGHWGDGTNGPPGTYYYERAEHHVLFWNMFDQIFIRPELLSKFRNEDLHILENDGHVPLVTTRGVPDSLSASDHLPILFILDI